MLTYADVCGRMLTYADVAGKGVREAKEALKKAEIGKKAESFAAGLVPSLLALLVQKYKY